MPDKYYIFNESPFANPGYYVFNAAWPIVSDDLRHYLNDCRVGQINTDRALSRKQIGRIERLLPSDGTARYALDEHGQVYFGFAREGVEVGYNGLRVSDAAIGELRRRFGAPSSYPLQFSGKKLTSPDVAADQTHVAIPVGEERHFLPITPNMTAVQEPLPKQEPVAAPAIVTMSTMVGPAPAFANQAAQIKLMVAITNAARGGNTEVVKAVEAYLYGSANDGKLSEGESVAMANRLQDQAPAAKAKIHDLVDQLKAAGVEVAGNATVTAPASAEPRQR